MQSTIFKDPKIDFKDLKYPVFSVEANLLDKIPQLKPYAELLATQESIGRPDIDKLIRYVMVLYDKRSPLIKQFSNLQLRKTEAAIVSGYNIEKDAGIIEKLFDFTDKQLQVLAIEFLKDQNDMYWSMIVSNEQTFYEYQKALLSEVTLFTTERDKLSALQIKAKLMDDCDTIAERVDTYYHRVFGEGDVNTKAKQKRSFTPENIANRNKPNV
jgi:hypothetical protein